MDRGCSEYVFFSLSHVSGPYPQKMSPKQEGERCQDFSSQARRQNQVFQCGYLPEHHREIIRFLVTHELRI